MPDLSTPAETTDHSLTVKFLDDDTGRQRLTCGSYPEAIDLVRQHQHSTTAVKILDRDDEIVFDSVEMDIDDWAAEWHHAKRRLAADDVEDRTCPYDSVGCFADNLCVRCQMDKVQQQHR